MSLVLTVFSLGTRVALAYLLSSIHTRSRVSVPIGWLLADAVGILYYVFGRRGSE